MVAGYGADALGFIFSKKSPRLIKEKVAKDIVDSLGPFVVKVGVFVDEEKEKVWDMLHFLKLDVLQFHGQESPRYCKFFQNRCKIIKTLFPSDAPFEKRMKDYPVDTFLFDIKLEEKVKGKKVLPPSRLKEIKTLIRRGCRVIVSGGLTPHTLSQVKKISPYAVDVCSGVEEFVGKKDKRLVELFIRKAKYEKAK
jgi:phosphoribosylanthranilate isomerase